MSETQFLGALVLGLASLVGLFTVFGKIIAKFVQSLTEVNSEIKSTKDTVSKFDDTVTKYAEHEKEGRRKLWDALENLEKKVDENRDHITQLEIKEKIHHQN